MHSKCFNLTPVSSSTFFVFCLTNSHLKTERVPTSEAWFQLINAYDEWSPTELFYTDGVALLSETIKVTEGFDINDWEETVIIGLGQSRENSLDD